LNNYLGGIAVAVMPRYVGLPSNLPSGPDPSLSLPATLTVNAAGSVVVPVNLDDPHPAGSSGLTEVQLALTYDPADFSVTPQDVQLGSVPQSGTGWTLQTVVDPTTGELGITLSSVTPIASTASGSLVTITLQETATATPGLTPIALVASVDPNGEGVISTMLDDNQGPWTLTPAPSNSSVVLGLESLVVLSATNPARREDSSPPERLAAAVWEQRPSPWEQATPVTGAATAGSAFWTRLQQQGTPEEQSALDEYFVQLGAADPRAGA
jgi:hypothetical protein